ncbi:translation initiation factor eIF4e [Mycena olivaceomarginata]|nr:translation initiation factor eIF4e [Mycena olivaceomarginata]
MADAHTQTRSDRAPNTTPTTASNAQIAGKAPRRRARSTSKHFSTSVEAHGHGHGHGDEEADGAVPLPSRAWVFWFRQQRTPGNKFRVTAFSSVESLWALTTHLAPPSALAPTTDYLLFHAAVQRPLWEDPLSITGSWEDDSHAEAGGEGTGDAPEICGCAISVRQSEDIISLWNRVDDVRVRERIRDTLRTVLGPPRSNGHGV